MGATDGPMGRLRRSKAVQFGMHVMTNILKFPNCAMPRQTGPAVAAGAAGQIVPFTGVRYERTTEGRLETIAAEPVPGSQVHANIATEAELAG